jgi:hypothetical protein
MDEPLPASDRARVVRGPHSPCVALDGSVDGGPSDAEQVSEFGGAVLAGIVESDEVGFLAGVELGLFAAQAALGLGDLHPLACAQANQVGLKLGDHGKDVEQQPPDRISRVMDGSAKTELDLSTGEVFEDETGVRQRAR